MTHRTIPALFETSVQKFPNNVLLLEKRQGVYEELTYAQTQDWVSAFGAGLMSLGLKSGDRVALISEGRNDWVIGELGILSVGAINVPLSVKLQGGSDLSFRLRHSECRFAITSASQAQKVRQVVESLPLLEQIILLDEMEPRARGETTFEETCAAGRIFLREHPDAFASRQASIRENDPATICYTSGTTADPKGVILTHRNYTANVEQSSAMFHIPESYCSLLILPWDHCFAHTAGIYTLMRNGASMAAVQGGKNRLETLKNIPLNIKETHPSFLLSVPSLAKSFRKSIETGVRNKGKIASTLFSLGLRTAYCYHADGWSRGKGPRALLRPLVVAFDELLFRKIRETFGGSLKFFVGGGALLDVELQQFFSAIGIPMLQGYGLTESSPVISANMEKKHKFGSSGAIVPSLEVKICDEHGNVLPDGSSGEIVVRGENVMAGYWKNETATREMIRDGWLYTGDLGYQDGDGFLFVLGRFKSLLIANDGEKYSPESIEETISCESKYIDQLMLFNNQSPFTVGLVVPNKEAVLAWMRTHGHSPATEKGQSAVLGLIVGEIDAYRDGGSRKGLFPGRWLPSAVAVLEEGFTEQNGLLNSTLKMVRGRILKRYEGRIEHLFSSEGKNIFNTLNRNAIAAWNDEKPVESHR